MNKIDMNEIKDLILKNFHKNITRENNFNKLKLYDFNVVSVNIDSFLKKQNQIWNFNNFSICEEVIDNLIFILYGDITESKIKKITNNIKNFKRNKLLLKNNNINIRLEQELYQVSNLDKNKINFLYKLLNESFIRMRNINLNLKKENIIYKKNIFILTENEENLTDALLNFHIDYKKKRRNEETKACINKKKIDFLNLYI